MGTLRRAPFGRTGMDITRVGFGAWAIGGAWQWGWGQVDDAESVDQARQELALLYLQQDRIRTALPVFLEFAGAPDERRDLRAFGLAGEAIVFGRQGDTVQACRALELLLPLQASLDPRLNRQVAQVLPDLLTKLDPKIAADWGAWLGRLK